MGLGKNLFLKDSVIGRNLSLDVLRVLACFGVMFIHISSSFSTHQIAVEGTAGWYAGKLIGVFSKWAVPAFVMITGLFMLDPKKDVPFKKLYGKHILRFVLSLIFWTWVYALVIHTRYYPFGGQDNNFWYMGMCIGIYISLPVLRLVAANEKILAYSCWIWFFIRCYEYVNEFFMDVPIVITDFVFRDYVGYCLWGYYLSRIQLRKKEMLWVYFAGFIGLVLSVVLPLATHDKVRCRFESPMVFAMTVAIFLFAIRHPINLSDKMNSWIVHFSKMTFGIYMVHSLVYVELFSRLLNYVTNPFALILASLIVLIVPSYFIILIIKQIPVLNKWVI